MPTRTKAAMAEFEAHVPFPPQIIYYMSFFQCLTRIMSISKKKKPG